MQKPPSRRFLYFKNIFENVRAWLPLSTLAAFSPHAFVYHLAQLHWGQAVVARLAIAIWWFGVVVGVGGALAGMALGTVEVLVNHEEPWVFWGYGVGAIWSLVTAVTFMGISYVLGGSFWKPPKAD